MHPLGIDVVESHQVVSIDIFCEHISDSSVEAIDFIFSACFTFEIGQSS